MNMTSQNLSRTNSTAVPPASSNSLVVGVILSIANITAIFFGSWGNLLVVIVVVCNKGLHSSTNFFISSLASADLIVTSICMPIFFAYNVITWPVWPFGSAVCRISSFLVHMSVMASALSLLAISYDRFLSIFFPMKRFVTPYRAKGVVACIWTISPLLLVPSLLHHDVVKTTYGGKDALMCQETWDTTYQLHSYQLYRVSCYYLFVLQISVLYFAIGCKLYKREPPGVQTIQSKAKLNQDKKKIIKMLFSVVLLFTFSWLPYIINKMLNIFPPWESYKSPDEFVFVGNFLGLVNSVANPIVYAALNKNFRVAFNHAIRCHCKYERDERRRQSIVSMRNTTQTKDGKRSSNISITFRQMPAPSFLEKRKNSVFGESMDWGADEYQIRCLSFMVNEDDSSSDNTPQNNRRDSSDKQVNSQRRVSFGPEKTNEEVALEELQWENTSQTSTKRNQRNSVSRSRQRSSTASSLGPIKENSNFFEANDLRVNQGFNLD